MSHVLLSVCLEQHCLCGTWLVLDSKHVCIQIAPLIFSTLLFPELYYICLARAKEKWRSRSTVGAEVECEGMFSFGE